MKLYLDRLNSPLGEISLVCDDKDQVRALEFGGERARLHRSLREHYADFDLREKPAGVAIRHALSGYFDGDLDAIDAITPVTGGTELQRQVWFALRRIPVGTTMNYGELARSLGYTDPRMAIEVGAANAANPIAIVVPCHRVIGKSGDLKGYAWGLHRKRWLLEHEGALRRLETAGEPLRFPGF
jgi:methylated-DNA-[protein]-cysteine S-methyltransferase